eukprot:Hpha_TRINITY_DN16545_c7_g9::TRINITY_DN16545_c7_g9_i1::g.133158::m.133158
MLRVGRMVGVGLVMFFAGAVCATPGPLPLKTVTRLTMMQVAAHRSEGGSYSLAFDTTNLTAPNFKAVHACARKEGGAAGKPHEILVTLALNIPLWGQIADEVSTFGPVAVKFLQDNDLDGMNFDWEDNVDTKVYMKLLKGLRGAFDKAVPQKKYLITVAPGWPRYPWDSSANGVVDAFDMMSYASRLDDCTSRVSLFTNTYKIPKETLLCAVECEPHWSGDPGWNTDADIVEKTKYTISHGLQGIFSFRIDNDHGPWPGRAQPTYHGADLVYQTAMNATAGNIGDFVINTYISLQTDFWPEQLQC